MSKPYLVTAEQPTFNLLIMGDPGAGKTHFGGEAQDHPEMRNLLVANIEGGLLTLAHRGDIKAIDIKSTNDLWNLAWKLAQGKYSRYRTLMVDNITELLGLNLREQVLASINSGRNMVKNRQRTIDDVWQEDYLKATSELSRLFQFLRDLPMHVILTSHIKRVYPKVPEGTDMTRVEPVAIVPDLSQKLMTKTMGYMDFVWCLETDDEDTDQEDETKRRFLVTTSKGTYRCKTRGPLFYEAIGDVVDNPSLPELYDTFVRTAHAHARKRERKA